MNFGGVNHPIGPPKGPPTVLNWVSFGIKILSSEYKGHLWLYFFILYSFGILFSFSLNFAKINYLFFHIFH